MLARSIDPNVKRRVDTTDDEEQCPDVLEWRVDPGFFLFEVVSSESGGPVEKKKKKKKTHPELTSSSLCGRLAWLDFASEPIVPTMDHHSTSVQVDVKSQD